MLNLSEKPKFVTDITWVQKILMGISGSMFLVSAITLIDFVEKLFKPDFLYQLSVIRASTAGISLVLAGCVGVMQLSNLVSMLFKFYEYAKKFKETAQDIADANNKKLEE